MVYGWYHCLAAPTKLLTAQPGVPQQDIPEKETLKGSATLRAMVEPTASTIVLSYWNCLKSTGHHLSPGNLLGCWFLLATVLSTIHVRTSLETILGSLSQRVVFHPIFADKHLIGVSLHLSAQSSPCFYLPTILAISNFNNFEFP